MESIQGSLEEIFPRRERLFDQLFRGATRQRDAGTGRFVWRFAGQKLDGEGWHYRVKGSRGVVMESWPVSPPPCFVPERDPPLPPAFLFSRVALKRDIGRMDSSSSIVFDSDYLFLTWKRIVEEEELYVELFETFEKYIYIHFPLFTLPRKRRFTKKREKQRWKWFLSPFLAPFHRSRRIVHFTLLPDKKESVRYYINCLLWLFQFEDR